MSCIVGTILQTFVAAFLADHVVFRVNDSAADLYMEVIPEYTGFRFLNLTTSNGTSIDTNLVIVWYLFKTGVTEFAVLKSKKRWQATLKNRYANLSLHGSILSVQMHGDQFFISL